MASDMVTSCFNHLALTVTICWLKLVKASNLLTLLLHADMVACSAHRAVAQAKLVEAKESPYGSSNRGYHVNASGSWLLHGASTQHVDGSVANTTSYGTDCISNICRFLLH